MTGRASVQWFEQNKKVLLIDFCEDGLDGPDVMSIVDKAAEWSPTVAAPLLELGLQRTELLSTPAPNASSRH